MGARSSQSKRTTPWWAIAAAAPVVALGIAGLIRGEVVGAAVFVGAPVALFVLVLLVNRRRSLRLEQGEPSVLRWLTVWGIGIGAFGAFLLLGGSVAIASGAPVAATAGLATGVVAMYVVWRIIQSIVTVRRLLRYPGDDGLREQAIVVGRQPGAQGFAGSFFVVGVTRSRLAIARASVRQAQWEFRPLTAASRVGVWITGSGGDLEIADGEFKLHLTAIPARHLIHTQQLLPAS
jgi:hypothetical protein